MTKTNKTNGNQEITIVASPNSDMVCGIPHRTEIDLNTRTIVKSLDTRV